MGKKREDFFSNLWYYGKKKIAQAAVDIPWPLLHSYGGGEDGCGKKKPSG